MANIDYFFSVLSPFAYLAGGGLEEIAAKHGASIRYIPVDIMDLFSKTGGTPPKDRHKSRLAYRRQELVRIAKMKGVPINTAPAHWPTDPIPASGAVIRASSQDGDLGALVRSILRSCWANDLDIANLRVLEDCLEQSGFSRSAARGSGEFLGVYRANTAEAVERGVFGSPTYVVEDQVFWGQDRLSHLDAWLNGDI